jgi:multicomponent Na+:H+ antiporter subunit D
MGGGSVLFMTGETRMSQLGGLYKKMPWTFLLTLIGGLSISAFPLFSGFVSKSMIVQAGFDNPHLYWAAFFLMLASIGTFYCNGLKVPYFVWFGKRQVLARRARSRRRSALEHARRDGHRRVLLHLPRLLHAGPLQPAAVPGGGACVQRLHAVPYFRDAAGPALHGACAFFVLVKLKKIEPHAGTNVDLDWFYRIGGRAFLWLARKPVQLIDTAVGEIYRVGGLVPLMKSATLVGLFDNHVIDGAVDGLASTVRGIGQRLRGAQRGAMQDNLTVGFAIVAGLILAFLFFKGFSS